MMAKEKTVNYTLKAILLAIALLPLLYFHQVEHVPLKAFILGTGSWGIGLIGKMIAHQLVIVRLAKAKISNLVVSLVNGALSGLFELLAALVVILLMKDRFDFDFSAIISFGLAIGSFESLLLVWQGGEDLLKGTALEKSTSEIQSRIEKLSGATYVVYHLVFPVIERIMSTVIHIATRGLIFVTVISQSLLPAAVALATFIIADGVLGYYFNISGKLKTDKGFLQVYLLLLILTVLVTAVFFWLVNPFREFVL